MQNLLQHINNIEIANLTEEQCVLLLAKIRWQNKPDCPHCGNSKVYIFSNNITYKCAVCIKKFTVKVGTFLQDSKLPVKKWFLAYKLYNQPKVSSVEVAKQLNVTQKTAWLMLQKINNQY